jgi:hypothetical protein
MRHPISPKDESFPSKERPLLGRLENRRERERERERDRETELYLYGCFFFN